MYNEFQKYNCVYCKQWCKIWFFFTNGSGIFGGCFEHLATLMYKPIRVARFAENNIERSCVALFGVVYFHNMLQAAKMFNTHEYKMKSESFLNEHWICSAYMATLSRTSVIKVLNSVAYINMCFTKYQRRYGYFSFLFLIMFWFLIRLGCFHESGNLL